MRLSSIISLVASSALALADASLRELAKDFPIGVAANSWKFSDETYVETLSQFNTMVAENACKFKAIQREQGVWNFDECDAHYQKAVELGQKFRGHCLLWFNYQPKWFQEITDADVMEKTIVEHITNVLDHYRGKIDTWDVVNEAIEDTATGENGTWELRDCNLTNVLPNYIDIAFKTAREVDPTVKLFYNDYEIEGDDIHEGKKTNAVYNLVKDMVERGVPIDGVGIQYHLHTDKPVKYENVMKTIARFGELGLEVQITEMDVNSVEGKTEESFALQAKLYREGLKACLDSPNCTAFLIWGVSDADSWRRNGYPLIFNTDYTPKPAYYALIDVLKEYNGIENDAEVLESVINEPENEVAVDENENVDDADDSSDSDDENVLKIMTIGDSITFGLAETGGYRKYLNYFLKEKGYTNVDFVGPEGDEVANFTYNGEVVTYDDNHAGYSGFTIMQQPDSWSDDSGLYEKLISKDAIKKYQPDIVLLIIGTNDMTANRSMEDCEKDLHTLLDYILGDLPSTSMIFIGSIPEYILYGGTPEKVANYNKTVKKVADDYTASGKNVEFADIHGCLDGVNDLSDDDIHPSGAGYEKMGKFWADVIDDYLSCEDDEEIPTESVIPTQVPEVTVNQTQIPEVTEIPTENPTEVPTEVVENNENDENILKIMTIGDSITFGLAETGGYRKYLNYFLKEMGYTNVDFVGPEGDEVANFTYNGEVVTYDDNHAGYSGFTIMQQPDSWSDDSGLYEKLISKDAIKKYQPDIVLLIIGTNDMTANRSMEDCEKDLHTLLDYILGDLPSTSMIFIGSIPEYILYGGTPEKVANYNKTVKKVADDYTASGKNVEFADIHGCLDGVNDLSDDDIHPSGAGYEKMGKFWAGVIDGYLKGETQNVTEIPTNVTEIPSEIPEVNELPIEVPTEDVENNENDENVLKIMTIGDSITFGLAETGGYRKYLNYFLKEKGYTGIDFVGPEGDEEATFTYNGEVVTYDDNHAGYSGFTIMQQPDSWSDDSGLYEKLISKDAIKKYQPDIVLLIIGTNDMTANRSMEDCEKDLHTLLDYILGDLPSTSMIFIGSIPEYILYGGTPEKVANYNKTVKKVADDYTASGKNVEFADIHGCLDGVNDLSDDDIHPSGAGYEKMGKFWADVIDDFLSCEDDEEIPTDVTEIPTEDPIEVPTEVVENNEKDENVLKIMTIGDSITFGLAETGGYRKYLNYFLKEMGYTNVDFVGPEGDEVANFTYNGEVVTYDDNHAGYSGFTIMQQPDSWSDDSGLYEKLISKDAIKKYQPDIVLLIIGTNDMTANRSMEDCEKDLHTLLDYILGDLPSTSMIFIGSIPEYILYGGTPEKVANYNKTVKKVAIDYSASGENVEFADIHGCLDGVNDLSDDDIHPSGAGYEKMGKFWAGVIDGYLKGETQNVTEIPTDVTEIPSEIPEVNELPIEVPTEDVENNENDENVLKIMTIGDSITFGLAETGGYRKYLNYFLKEKGYTGIDFVGPEGDEVANFTYNGEVVTYDDNHAGYSGFTIMQQPDSWSDDSGLYEKLISKDAIKKYQPDIVLLIIGTNDMTANRSMEDCEKDLHTLLDYILGDLPSTSMIFIGSIPEYILYGGTPEKVANYNKTVKKVADDYTASGKNVEFADIHGCLDGVNDLSDDDIHPSGAGYEKMGKFWADVIDDYLTCEDDEEIPTDVTEIPSEIPEVNELPIEVPTEDVENNENDENVLKIMTIGDSITFGLAETGGYRKYLNYFLKEKGYTGIDFVGPEGDEEATFTYNGEVVTYDDNHAGYSGFTIMQQPDSWSDDSGLYEKLISKDAIKKYQPDIVLLIIGTNDMTANRSMEDCEKDLHTLLDYILGDLPSTSMIFIGSIPEYILYGGTPEKVANYNKTVKKVADDYTASGKNVEFADIHGCLDGVNDLSDDDIHPSGAGYEKMGKFWADVIDDYLTCEDEE